MRREWNLLNWNEAVCKAGRTLELDPQLVALVQFLARRAAEADYGDAQISPETQSKTIQEKEDHE